MLCALGYHCLGPDSCPMPTGIQGPDSRALLGLVALPLPALAVPASQPLVASAQTVPPAYLLTQLAGRLEDWLHVPTEGSAIEGFTPGQVHSVDFKSIFLGQAIEMQRAHGQQLASCFFLGKHQSIRSALRTHKRNSNVQGLHLEGKHLTVQRFLGDMQRAQCSKPFFQCWVMFALPLVPAPL